ncbi:MAG: hypothetical protein E3J35_04350 [Methanomassiliicoccales archaeon]|nr:MAG: hypothetical protein E3J35_04350 [Methanomassiliicoccales archaeon]
MSVPTMQRDIIFRMFRRRIIGGVHKSREGICGWFRKDLRGEAKDALDDLVKSGLVIEKPTSYGKQYSLNRDRLGDIIRIIEEHLDED